MNLDDWGQFFAMGGYGDYVWSAYLVVAVTLIANIWVPLRSRTAVLRRLRALADKPANTRPARPTRPARAIPKANGQRGATRTGATTRNKPKTTRKGK